MIPTSECKTHGIRIAEVMVEGAGAEGGPVAEEGDAAVMAAERVMKIARKCTNSSARPRR